MTQNELFARADRLLEERFPQLVEDIGRVVAIPSTEGEPAEGAPYGAEVARVLEEALAICRRMGFETENVDGHCGLADWPGQTARQVGVLAHLDVVPACAEEWDTPPFTATVKDGWLYGRGVVDDKGPLFAALYAAAALRDAGAELRNTVRFLMGCNEEGGMQCMEYYLTKYPQPDFGFTPDGHFPAIIGEKGIFHYTLSRSWQAEACEGPQLLSVSAGHAPNVIPATAQAVLANADGLAAQLAGCSGITVAQQGSTLTVTANGQAAHASTPQDGDNAISYLLKALRGAAYGPAGAKQFLDEFADLLEDDRAGSGFGVAEADALSAVTHAPTMLHVADGRAELMLDMRFLVTKKAAEYRERLQAFAAAHNCAFAEHGYHDPLYLGENHPLAGMLMESYREVTGDLREPEVIGGGSYAKTMKDFIAFGAEPAGSAEMAHQNNEAIECSHLLNCTKIFARAIYRMGMAE